MALIERLQPHSRLLWAIGFGLLAVALVWFVMAEQRRAMTALGRPVRVWIAAHDIDAGVLLEAHHWREQRIPEQFVPPTAVRDPLRLHGTVTRAPLQAGEIFTATRIALPADQTIGTATIPRGYRAVAIPFRQSHGWIKMVHPNDRVDVLAEFGVGREGMAEPFVITLLQDVRVVALEAQAATLLVTPSQAQDLAFAQLNGELLLTLRPPHEESHAAVLSPATAASVTGLPHLIPRREYRGR